MSFLKYQSLKQLGKKDVEGINNGVVYLFSKLDGTNANTFTHNQEVRTGSRNRMLSIQSDNAGFCAYINQAKNIQQFHKDNPKLRLFGEWLVPHTIRDYKNDAWNKFYIFDVVEDIKFSQGTIRYLTYEEYQPLLEKYDLDYIPLITKLKNPTESDIAKYIKDATFCLEDGKEPEGIVVKNYNYTNNHGNIIWAKYINPNFTNGSTRHKKVIDKGSAEEYILDTFATQHLIEKEFAKIKNEVGKWHPKHINRLFHTVYFCILTEELSDSLWYIMKAYKNPNINFNEIRLGVQTKVREVMGDILIEEEV